MGQPAQLHKLRPNQRANLNVANHFTLPIQERPGAASQIKCRPRQGQRLQPLDGAVLEDTQTHGITPQ
jgi:hypothetical protein